MGCGVYVCASPARARMESERASERPERAARPGPRECENGPAGPTPLSPKIAGPAPRAPRPPAPPWPSAGHPPPRATMEGNSTPPPTARHVLKERGRVEVSERGFSKVRLAGDEVFLGGRERRRRHESRCFGPCRALWAGTGRRHGQPPTSSLQGRAGAFGLASQAGLRAGVCERGGQMGAACGGPGVVPLARRHLLPPPPLPASHTHPPTRPHRKSRPPRSRPPSS